MVRKGRRLGGQRVLSTRVSLDGFGGNSFVGTARRRGGRRSIVNRSAAFFGSNVGHLGGGPLTVKDVIVLILVLTLVVVTPFFMPCDCSSVVAISNGHSGATTGVTPFRCSGLRRRCVSHANRGLFPRVFKASGLDHSCFVHIVCNAEIDLSINIVTTVVMLVVKLICNSITKCFNKGISLVVVHVISVICSLPSVLVVVLLSIIFRRQLGPLVRKAVFRGLKAGVVSVFVIFKLLC